MTTIQVCRTCLAQDTRMYTIANTTLDCFYEKVTNLTFSTQDGRPSVVCYICYHLLKKCQRFAESAIKANKVLQEICRSGIQITEQYISLIDKSLLISLQESPVTHENITSEMPESEDLAIKIENEIGIVNATEIVEAEVYTTTQFEVKKETVMDVNETDGENKCCTQGTLQQLGSHNSSDSSVSEHLPLDDIKLEEEAVKNEIILENEQGIKDTNANACTVVIKKDKQIEQTLVKAKSAKYLRSRLKCELCCKGFANLRAFGDHQKKHEQSIGAFECDSCHIRHRTAIQLEAHAATCRTNRRYACDDRPHRPLTT